MGPAVCRIVATCPSGTKASRGPGGARSPEAIPAMPEELREMLVLFELEELSMQEISLALDLKMGTVASRLRRAREKFAEISERSMKSRGGLR